MTNDFVTSWVSVDSGKTYSNNGYVESRETRKKVMDSPTGEVEFDLIGMSLLYTKNIVWKQQGNGFYIIHSGHTRATGYFVVQLTKSLYANIRNDDLFKLMNSMKVIGNQIRSDLTLHRYGRYHLLVGV